MLLPGAGRGCKSANTLIIIKKERKKVTDKGSNATRAPLVCHKIERKT